MVLIGSPKKWWHCPFWGILDIMFINSYVVYKNIHSDMSLLDFRRSVVQGLMRLKEIPTPNKNNLCKRKNKPSPQSTGNANKKRRG